MSLSNEPGEALAEVETCAHIVPAAVVQEGAARSLAMAVVPRRRVSMSDVDRLRWEMYLPNKGDTVRRNELVERYLPIVRYQAERLAASLPESVDPDDLLMDGVFGLMDAIDAYDLDRGVKFESFCVLRVSGAMKDGLRAADWVPRLVRSRSKRMNELVGAFREANGGRMPSREQIVALLGMEEGGALERILADSQPIGLASLQSPVYENERGATSLASTIADEREAEPDEGMAASELFDLLFSSLTGEERILMTLYYARGLTMKRIGAVLGVSESRISQMHSEIVAHLYDRCRDHFGRGDALDMLFRQHVLWRDDDTEGDEEVSAAS